MTAADPGDAELEAGRLRTDAPLALLALLALLTVVTLELIRSSGPLLTMAFEVGVVAAAGSAVAAYSSPGVIVLVLQRLSPRSGTAPLLLVGVGVLAVARLAVQALDGWVRFGVGLATIAVAVAVLTLGVAVVAGHRHGGSAAAAAVAVGGAAGVGIQLALGTWDAYWRDGYIGWGVTGVVVGSMLVCAWSARRDAALPSTRRVRGTWALGPALALMVMMLANPGFASAQSDRHPVIAGLIAAVGLLAAGALAFLAAHRQVGSYPLLRNATSLLAVLLAISVAGVLWASGSVTLLLLVTAQVGLVAVLTRALEPVEPAGGEVVRSPNGVAGDASLVGLGAIVPLMVFQLDYDIPLGVPNGMVIIAAAVVLTAAVRSRRGVGAVGGGSRGRPVAQPLARLLVLGGAVVLAGTGIATARAATATPPAVGPPPAEPLTLVSWNLHFGVDPDGDVNLEQIARTIEEQGASVVTLQEVSRGWVMAAGTDMATWLAERLEMRVVFSPGADRRFGNAILTDLQLDNVTRLALPYGQGPQNRSALSADLITSAGPVRVTSVHLQSKDTTPTRLEQIDALLTAEGDATQAIIAGDFNAEPGWPEIARMTAADLVSAQDVAGDPSEMTSSSTDPRKRIDWIFGRGVVFTDAEVLSGALSSDHLPVVTTFSPMPDRSP